MALEPWTDGTGQNLLVHPASRCKAPCPIHAPSDHSMKDFPTHFRTDRGIMERICPHGVGHPDPDCSRCNDPVNGKWERVHGCDGCCGRVE